MTTKPILFLGDNPAGVSGLSRIMRDLTKRVATLPEFRVAVMGRGGIASRHLPYPIYTFPESAQWGEDFLPAVWQDFAGHDRGIIMTIWDPTRCSWLAMPHGLPDGSLRQFLQTKPFELWGYFPVDATGPFGRLSALGTATVGNYDRVLAYSQYGANVLSASLSRDIDWAPHGIDLSVFTPYPMTKGRDFLRTASGGRFSVLNDDILVGIVAINQARKDWGLVATVCHELKQRYGPRFKTWWHTDVEQRSHAWNMHALIQDFGLGSSVLLVPGIEWTDREMAQAYSACNVTLAPGMEGFGYPLAESMACGVPVVTGADHGGSELVTDCGGAVVPARAQRVEGIHNSIRSVHDPGRWVDATVLLIETPPKAEEVKQRIAFLDWDATLWRGLWSKWFMAGVR